MMFAIHGSRQDWDPLPTALKLVELEKEFEKQRGRVPNETELAELASLTRGEVRRLKNLLGLPKSYLDELLKELEKPRSRQMITVDIVLETTRGVAALRRRDVINDEEEEKLRQAIIAKFRSGVINNTVAPRQLARIGRAVERADISPDAARNVAMRLIKEPQFSITDAFTESVEKVDFEHGVDQVVGRLITNLERHQERRYRMGEGLRESLEKLRLTITRLLRAK